MVEPARLTEADYERASKVLRVPIATVKAVVEVESAGSGFLPSGKPTILYEAHVFHRNTKGRHAQARDQTGKRLSSPSWDKSLYGPGGDHQHERLLAASDLDWEAAHKSSSWGLFQILGENFREAGHADVKSFVDAMHESEGAQLDAFISYIQRRNLDGFLRQRHWAQFARAYNGPRYAENGYDVKLAQAYAKYSREVRDA